LACLDGRKRPVAAGGALEFVCQDEADKPERVRCRLQKEPARQLPRPNNIPVTIIVGEASYHAAYDPEGERPGSAARLQPPPGRKVKFWRGALPAGAQW
jgi:hypothetical protein